MKRNFVLPILAGIVCVAGTAFAAKTHVFREGDTLWELAAKHYGDPTLYPVLLEVNGIDNPRTISSGKVIIIPDKSDMKQIAGESDPEKKKELISKANAGNTDSDRESENPAVSPKTPDQVSRTGDPIDSEETGFTKILAGPKVGADKLIKMNTP
jgi:nucleoid-associated protein YgaU